MANNTLNFSASSAQLKVTPEELHRQSSEVSSNVNKIKRRFDLMERQVKATNSYWDGDAADGFRSVYLEFKDELDDILARLSEHIVDLEKMAGVYEKAESSVIELIETLPSDVIV